MRARDESDSGILKVVRVAMVEVDTIAHQIRLLRPQTLTLLTNTDLSAGDLWPIVEDYARGDRQIISNRLA